MKYETSFSLPVGWLGKRILLHFGAVDQIARVYVNGQLAGTHEGGYLPFTLDITDCVRQTNHLIIQATDTLSEEYPYGKQKKTPGGMWYTPVSGIWQSVWIEPVPEMYIRSLRFTPDENGVRIRVFPSCEGVPDHFLIRFRHSCITGADDSTDPEGLMASDATPEPWSAWYRLPVSGGYLPLDKLLRSNGNETGAQQWSPGAPHLYELQLRLGQDQVETYTGLRRIESRAVQDIPCILLNGKQTFLHGVLDQGYFQEGIYLPATPMEYGRDILRLKNLGFNMLRKHVKIEPQIFYTLCDRLGILVMQDMVNNGPYKYITETLLPNFGLTKRPDTLARTADFSRKKIFTRHMMDTIRHLYNHPSIIAYTIFNEGWGQFCADEMYEIASRMDPTRLIDATSGWFAQKKSDFDSVHVYFRDKKLRPGKRPMLVSECGGFGLVMEPRDKRGKIYNYGSFRSREDLTDRILKMYHSMILPVIPKGLCGCVYTQLSDVEGEVNGLFTYDRRDCKVLPDRLRHLAMEIGMLTLMSQTAQYMDPEAPSSKNETSTENGQTDS